MPWYSERRTPMGRWSPQITPEKPRERTNEGQRITLRRVQPLPAHLRGWPLDEVQRAIAASCAAHDASAAEIEGDGFITLHPPRHPATSIGE